MRRMIIHHQIVPLTSGIDYTSFHLLPTHYRGDPRAGNPGVRARESPFHLPGGLVYGAQFRGLCRFRDQPSFTVS